MAFFGMLPVSTAALLGTMGIFGLLFGLRETGKIKIVDPVFHTEKRDGHSMRVPTIFAFPQANLTEANMDIMRGMVAGRASAPLRHGHNAIFHNVDKNFSVSGLMTDVEKKHSHGIMHGRIAVPLGENDEMIEGKWISFDPEAEQTPAMDALVSFTKALEDVGMKHADILDMLKMVGEDDAAEN